MIKSVPLLVLPLIVLISICPSRADDPAGARAAHEELQAALNPGGELPSGPDMITHLKAAMKDLKDLPDTHEDRVYKRRADASIRAAISEINNGGTPNQIKADISDADSIVRDIQD